MHLGKSKCVMNLQKLSAVVEEAGKTVFPKKLGELVWDSKRRRYVQDSSSGTQAIRSEKNR